MYSLLKKACETRTPSLSFYSNLIDYCLSLESLDFSKFIHAQLIKVGFNCHTFLGNRFLDLYSRFGTVSDAWKVFEEIGNTNTLSWNICLKVFLRCGHFGEARRLFDRMPTRDVVSWNSMISGCASYGFVDDAFRIYLEMQDVGMKPGEFTLSILMSVVYSADHAKQIHGHLIRTGMNPLNLVLGNSLIDMYGKLRLADYAFGVFSTMQSVDNISWNSLIVGCLKSGYREFALYQFCIMRSMGHSPDHFTASTVITVCSNLQDLEMGMQIVVFCIKAGFLSNTVVSSAAIDLFSKCNRLVDSIKLFNEIDLWDSAVCNSMISTYARHGFFEDALKLFVLTLREEVRPNEFTLSSILSSASALSAEQGFQLHSLVLKLGLVSDGIVASSLMDIYAKFGSIDSAIKIFSGVVVRDLISWNIMIMGLACNGRVLETLNTFKKLLEEGLSPDRITLAGILLACKYGGFVDEGISIFQSMEKNYGVKPAVEHYACVIDMMYRAHKLEEAIQIIETMPHEPSALIWRLILHACQIHGDLKLTETVAERLMEMEPQSSLPYLVLAQAYEQRGRWESMIRVRKAMIARAVKVVIGFSWIGIRNHIVVFKANQMFLQGGNDIYLILNLLIWEMRNGVHVYQQDDIEVGEVQET